MLKTIKKIAGRAIAQRWLNVCLAFFVAASLTTACSDNDDDTLPIDTAQPNENVQPSENAQPAEQPSQPSEQPSQPEKAVHTLSVSIPATISDDGSLSKYVSIDGTTCTGIFQGYEYVYVYDVTDGAIVKGSLNPDNISDDGKSCTLVGTLTTNGDITGHEIALLYNGRDLYGTGGEVTDLYFSYRGQNGYPVDVTDAGFASGIKVNSIEDGKLTTDNPAKFTLQQAVFRLQFVDEGGTTIKPTQLIITSANEGIASSYYPFKEIGSQYGDDSKGIPLTIDQSITDYIYASVHIKEAISDGDKLTFRVIDDKREYSVTKDAPSGGFKNGKFYYNSAPMVLKALPREKPNITWIAPDIAQEPDDGGYIVMNSGGGSVQMAISGNSLGYFFSVISRPYGSIVTLDNLNATFDGKQYFLYSYYGINVVLNGDNSITCKNFEYAIYTFNQLKLSGDGTLTVTTNSSAERGIGGTNYTSESAPQALAADENHTVTISDMTDNGDGTYTWTYTVTPTSK